MGKNVHRENEHQDHRRKNQNRKCSARHNCGTQSFLFSFYECLFCFAAEEHQACSLLPAAIHCDDRRFEKENRLPFIFEFPPALPSSAEAQRQLQTRFILPATGNEHSSLTVGSATPWQSVFRTENLAIKPKPFIAFGIPDLIHSVEKRLKKTD